MAQEHDLGAEITGGYILSQIRRSDASYKQVFSPSMRRIGFWGWPRPDYVCLDESSNSTYALEYKPPMQSKREYVCGLGQTITYLNHHAYGGLILPEKADDGFHIAEYIKDVLDSDVMSNCPISLFSYNNNFEVKILRAIKQERVGVIAAPTEDDDRTFWCWWRDMSHYELYDLLSLSFIYSEYDGDAYTDCIFPEFWKKLINHETKTFEGTYRDVADSSMNSYKQNYRIPFEQLGLWSSKEGKLSDIGLKLLVIGKKYGANSANFKNALAYLILTTGHHIDLIHAINDIQKNMLVPPTNSMDYKKVLDIELTERGLIGKRKPTAVKTDSKGSYIRDELKLWNKFGFVNKNRRVYFFQGKGLDFNWERINEVLIQGKQW